MKEELTIIEHFEILTKYHLGLSNSEALAINALTKNGYCIYLETINNNEIVNWYIYAKQTSEGQLMSGSNFEQFKQNNYEPED